MKQINFTKEHQALLDAWVLKMTFSGTLVSGSVGSALHIVDLLHKTSTNTLRTIYKNLIKDLESSSKLDEWSMSDYQQQKIKEKKELADGINLLIGYRLHQEQKQETAEILKMKRSELQRLKEEKKTPEERIAELEKEIVSMES